MVWKQAMADDEAAVLANQVDCTSESAGTAPIIGVRGAAVTASTGPHFCQCGNGRGVSPSAGGAGMAVCEWHAVRAHIPAHGAGSRLGYLAYVVHYQGPRAVPRRHASPDRSRTELSKNLPTIVWWAISHDFILVPRPGTSRTSGLYHHGPNPLEPTGQR